MGCGRDQVLSPAFLVGVHIGQSVVVHVNLPSFYAVPQVLPRLSRDILVNLIFTMGGPSALESISVYFPTLQLRFSSFLFE